MRFNPNTTRKEVFQYMQEWLYEQSVNIDTIDDSRPWGGFFVIDEDQAEKFIEYFFSHLTVEELAITGKLSPKILVVAPGKRLSWQYHHRRAEIWKVIGGRVAVVTSDTDEEKNTFTLERGDIIQLKQGERHRLVGLDEWGVVAEIWRHTDAQHPSDETDIVRVQDDFGR